MTCPSPRDWREVWLWLALVVTFISSASGQPEPNDDGVATLDTRISLELKNASAIGVFTSLATLSGAEIQIDPVVEMDVTITLDNIRLRTAMTAVCEGIGCTWRLLEGVSGKKPTLQVLAAEETLAGKFATLDKPLSFDLEGASAFQSFASLAGLLEAELRFSPRLPRGTVTGKQEAKPVREILDELCRQLSCVWTLLEGQPSTLWVEPAP